MGRGDGNHDTIMAISAATYSRVVFLENSHHELCFDVELYWRLFLKNHVQEMTCTVFRRWTIGLLHIDLLKITNLQHQFFHQCFHTNDDTSQKSVNTMQCVDLQPQGRV